MTKKSVFPIQQHHGDYEGPTMVVRIAITETRTATALIEIPWFAVADASEVEDYLCDLDESVVADLIDNATYNEDYEVEDRSWSLAGDQKGIEPDVRTVLGLDNEPRSTSLRSFD